MNKQHKEFVFRHNRLDVYRAALELIEFVGKLDSTWFRGNPDRRRQLLRATDSIALNIAEGSTQNSDRARRNHYRIALGSAGESDAILQVLQLHRAQVSEGRRLLARIGAMLWRML